jgi:hypothetical protein
MKPLSALLVLVLSSVAWAQSQGALVVSTEKSEHFGAVLGPAALPDGAIGYYGYVGAPDLAVGFRQGTWGMELETRARVDYLRLTAGLDVGVRRVVYAYGPLEVAPALGMGVHFATGSTYFDRANFSAIWLRFTPALVAGYALTETVRALGLVDMPFDLSLDKSGGRRFQALGGGGAEVYVGEDLSVLAAGQLGVDALKEPQGPSSTRLGWAVRLGLGLRRF